MYKNQLQELAQRSCFNLPSYACVREGPDHAPRFKASVNFHGEIFEGPSNCTTVRQAEHAAAEVALTNLSSRGPSRSLTARVLDETGVYKNLLQETAHRAGLKLPVYITVRTGPGHQPIFTCTVELAAMSFTGEHAKTKKQAEKNAALAAWSALKQMPEFGSCSQHCNESESIEEHDEQVAVTRVLAKFSSKENRSMNQRHIQRRRVMLGSSRECFSSQNSIGYLPKWMSLASSSTDVSSKNSWKPSQQLNLIAHSCAKRLPHMPSFHSSAYSTQEPISSNDPSNHLSSFNKPIPVSAKKISESDLQAALLYLEKQQHKDEFQQIARKQPLIDNAKDHENYNIASKIHIPLYARSSSVQASNASGLTQVESKLFILSTPTVKTTELLSRQMLQVPNMFATGGFHASGIAPAVNIRTVIPVCASPPTSTAVNTTITTPKNEEEEDISKTISKLNKLQI